MNDEVRIKTLQNDVPGLSIVQTRIIDYYFNLISVFISVIAT